MAADLANDKFWVNKYLYHDAEKTYYEGIAKDGVGMEYVSKDPNVKSSLAVEVAKARELIKTSMRRVDGISALGVNDKSSNTVSSVNTDLSSLAAALKRMEESFKKLEKRVESLEAAISASCRPAAVETKQKSTPPKPKKQEDDLDLFDSEEEDEEAKKVREQRLAEYAAKKSKKPAGIAKLRIILDIKPWKIVDTKKLEEAVRAVEMEGLVWGASKLVLLVFRDFHIAG